ncbi:MAG: serine/threonine-protein phosphatase [Thermoflexales bacterium]|nr:serine/threonine-protein phosphatase [Thermoflexales bacterium]
MAMKLDVGFLSDTGQKRPQNEDFLGLYRPTEAEQRRVRGDLFLVADGMGGHASGEIASRTAVEQIIQAYTDPQCSPGRDSLAELVNAVTSANTSIYAMGGDQEQRWRMGTTLVGALVRERQLQIVNVGDSRAYLVRDGLAEQISQDHSLIAEQVRLGLVEAERAKEMEHQSTITRALGSRPEVEVDTFSRTLQAGDRIVLCTDGLSGLVADEEIAQVVSSQPPSQAASSLVGLANARGGRDNITTMVIQVHEEESQKTKSHGCLWALGGAALGLALLLGLLLALIPLTLGRSKDLPSSTPIAAPIKYTGGQNVAERDTFARMLGYSDEADLLIKAGLPPDQPWPPQSPTTVHVLLTGRVMQLKSVYPCKFTLGVSEQASYHIECEPYGQPTHKVELAKGDQVSLLGVLESADHIRPLTIDINRVKYLGLDSEWTNWYIAIEPGQRILVYTTVSSYTVREAGGRSLTSDYGFDVGDAVAIYSGWEIVQVETDQYVAPLSFEAVFRLDEQVYTSVAPGDGQ